MHRSWNELWLKSLHKMYFRDTHCINWSHNRPKKVSVKLKEEDTSLNCENYLWSLKVEGCIVMPGVRNCSVHKGCTFMVTGNHDGSASKEFRQSDPESAFLNVSKWFGFVLGLFLFVFVCFYLLCEMNFTVHHIWHSSTFSLFLKVNKKHFISSILPRRHLTIRELATLIQI